MNANEIKQFITKRVVHIRVQTELGTAVKVTKKDALTMIDTLARRGIIPTLNCTEVSPLRYLAIIQKPEHDEQGMIIID